MPFRSEAQRRWMYANHPKMAKKWSRHTRAQALPNHVRESGRENSTAMVILRADPPGRNVCSFLRNLVATRTKLIVAGQPGKLRPGDFERLIRASMPDCEKKLRVIDVGSSVAAAVSSAEANRHYRPSQALELFCDAQLVRNFRQEVSDGRLGFDPTVIAVHPVEIPSDDVEDIVKSVSSNDVGGMHRVLDPHVFSNQDSVEDYRQSLKTESLVREFLSDIASSRELGIQVLHDVLFAVFGFDAERCEYLGTGRNGSAYRHPGGFIIKVTTDPQEFSIGRVLCGLECEYIGNVFSAAQFDSSIFILLQEDLHPLSDDQKDMLDSAFDFIEDLGAMEALNAGDFELVTQVLTHSPAKKLASQTAMTLNAFRVLEMCYEVSELGLTADFHAGNVMLRSGSPVLVDLGTPGADPGASINEFGTGSPGSGASGPPTMRGSNSSSWASGQLALKDPQNHVPEDENETERDRALDWGPGRVSGASF